ncbi:SIR2 family NAD-dependent protein deacylase [Methyloversatilis thermotolerans]|uniref:SIR2 family NAD-dependent protein deacylase n=1 Tax=Methyloversatilis thermotolerans TaxID=1346290 RepID=UPI00037C0A97|nr:SIR2 family protein [Methyloversatilis thermotolerans]
MTTSTSDLSARIGAIEDGLRAGTVVPYLGPGMLSLVPEYAVPANPEALVALLTARVSVPHKIRNRLTQAAQFIENFKHRKTLVDQMNSAFAASPLASPLHAWLAGLGLPLIVDAWYDEAMAAALQEAGVSWGEVQGLSQSEHFGTWTGWYDKDGNPVPDRAPDWKTILYKPIGSASPAANYLVSDTDYVEVLTEIDIQTPIPQEIQALRSGRSFLFLGCRFNDQLTRTFARQIMKRSSDRHWVVMPEEPTRMEAKFLGEQNITRIVMPLSEFAERVLAPAAV